MIVIWNRNALFLHLGSTLSFAKGIVGSPACISVVLGSYTWIMALSSFVSISKLRASALCNLQYFIGIETEDSIAIDRIGSLHIGAIYDCLNGIISAVALCPREQSAVGGSKALLVHRK